jgi:hypothetical protein
MNERIARLQRREGEPFGFKLRRGTSKKSYINYQFIISFIVETDAELQLAEDSPALHKLIDVVEHGYAYQASLRDEDLLIEVTKPISK